MQINITGKNLKITPSLRDFINKKMTKLINDFEHPINCEVVIEVEKLKHIAEINISGDSGRFYFKKDAHNLYQAIENVVHAANVSIRKFKEKQKDRKSRIRKEYRPSVAPSRPLEKDYRIQKLNRDQIKPMTLEEAILQLKYLKQNILIFNNSVNFQTSILIQDQNYFNLIQSEKNFIQKLFFWKKNKKEYTKISLFEKNNKVKKIRKQKMKFEISNYQNNLEKILQSPQLSYVVFRNQVVNKICIFFRIHKNYLGYYEF